jgi:hypothetical protein
MQREKARVAVLEEERVRYADREAMVSKVDGMQGDMFRGEEERT